jgi:tripartite-type tricarboxylate transporter receptor subunit TctC
MVTYPSVAEQLKAGRLRALAAASLSRIELLPDVPTVAGSGYKNYEPGIWYGVAVPAKTPRAAIAQLAGLFTAALQAAETKRKLLAQRMIPVGRCGGDFGGFLRKFASNTTNTVESFVKQTSRRIENAASGSGLVSRARPYGDAQLYER